jgi:hypothetical protein
MGRRFGPNKARKKEENWWGEVKKGDYILSGRSMEEMKRHEIAQAVP